VLTPSKGGGSFYAIKATPITGKTISELLEGLVVAKRTKELSGWDPTRGVWSKVWESQSGALFEQATGVTLRRATGDEAGDFVFTKGVINGKVLSGKTLDQLGPPPAPGFSLSKFLNSVDDHFNKSVDYLLLDMRSFDETTKTAVRDHIDKKWSSQKERLFTIE
jgi:hypothetical protein